MCVSTAAMTSSLKTVSWRSIGGDTSSGPGMVNAKDDHEAMCHMVEFIGWVIQGADYELNPCVMESAVRWAQGL